MVICTCFQNVVDFRENELTLLVCIREELHQNSFNVVSVLPAAFSFPIYLAVPDPRGRGGGRAVISLLVHCDGGHRFTSDRSRWFLKSEKDTFIAPSIVGWEIKLWSRVGQIREKWQNSQELASWRW